jgi:hypothetical protein
MAELKEQALLERIGQLTVDYENKVADLRVALTQITDQKDQVTRERDALIAANEQMAQQNVAPPPEEPKVLEGTVVQ